MTPQNTEVKLSDALRACRGAFLAVIFFSFFINLLMFVGPLYMLQVYDRVLMSRSESTLVMLSLLALGLLLTYGLLEWIRSRVLVRVSGRFDYIMNERVFGSVFRQGVLVPGGGQAQALRDLDMVREFLSGAGILVLSDAPWAPIFVATVFFLHPVLGYVALAGAVAILVLALLNNLLTTAALRDATRENIQSNTYITATLRNAEVLEAMGMAGGVRDRWAKQHGAVLGLQSRASDRSGLVLSLSKFVRMGLQVAILGAGAYLAIIQEITPGMMIAASILMGRGLAPVEQAVGQWKAFTQTRIAYQRLRDFLAAVPVPTRRISLPDPKGELDVQGVLVVPPGRSGAQNAVLNGVGFKLHPGQVLGVIGPSGAGKSTLARVLVGVWPIVSGSVRLDGAQLAHWNRDELGPHIGYLPQDVELLGGTVAENIARFGKLDSDEIIKAAKKAGVHEMVLRLPQAYDTQIGPGGQSLSGGQRQRIGLARALYGNPALLVLDEPNSNLDSEGEVALAAAIKQLRDEHKTVVVISHRPALLSCVDKILVLKDGRMADLGDRDAVLARFAKPTVAA